MNPEKLIFVYNAETGLGNALLDAAHKLISPSTYECALCAITYGAVSMRREWRDYLSGLPFETQFFHRDDFQAAWPGVNAALPAIFVQTSDQPLEVLVGPPDFKTADTVAKLITLCEKRLATRA